MIIFDKADNNEIEPALFYSDFVFIAQEYWT